MKFYNLELTILGIVFLSTNYIVASNAFLMPHTVSIDAKQYFNITSFGTLHAFWYDVEDI